ncbi:MAG: hypothetical protein U0547_03940 [Dehalococcoidia bacterium]
MTEENASWWPRPASEEGAVSASQVLVERSAVRSVDADQARLERAAVQRLRAGHATIERSAVAMLEMERGTLVQSSAGVVIARSVAADETHVGVLVAPVVRGEVHTWLDMRSAVAIGVGIVMGRALLGVARAALRRQGA